MFLQLGGTGNQFEKNGHAHGEAVGDLLENAGLQTVGDGRIDFEAANHRARMQNDGVGVGKANARGRELITQNIFVGGKRRLVEAFLLDTKRHDDVGAFKGFFQARNTANARREGFEFARKPHGGAAERDASAEFREQMNIRARDAAVQNVADNGDVAIVEGAGAAADGERVEECLRGMLVGAEIGRAHV